MDKDTAVRVAREVFHGFPGQALFEPQRAWYKFVDQLALQSYDFTTYYTIPINQHLIVLALTQKPDAVRIGLAINNSPRTSPPTYIPAGSDFSHLAVGVSDLKGWLFMTKGRLIEEAAHFVGCQLRYDRFLDHPQLGLVRGQLRFLQACLQTPEESQDVMADVVEVVEPQVHFHWQQAGNWRRYVEFSGTAGKSPALGNICMDRVGKDGHDRWEYTANVQWRTNPRRILRAERKPAPFVPGLGNLNKTIREHKFECKRWFLSQLLLLISHLK